MPSSSSSGPVHLTSEARAADRSAAPSRSEAWAAGKVAASSQLEAPAEAPPRHPPFPAAPALEGAPSRRRLPAASLSARIAACTARSCAAGRPAPLRSSNRNRRSTSVGRPPRSKQSAENFSARHAEESAGASARSLPIISCVRRHSRNRLASHGPQPQSHVPQLQPRTSRLPASSLALPFFLRRNPALDKVEQLLLAMDVELLVDMAQVRGHRAARGMELLLQARI